MKLQRNVSANINKNNNNNNKAPSWENEKLFEKTIKLQNELNNLNQKYYLIKIENEHQKDEILRHKKVLDEYNIDKEEEKKNIFRQITFNRTLKTKKSKTKNENNDDSNKTKKYKMKNETLINNLKNHCNLLSKNNKELDEKILNLKRNKKNSQVNEFLIEKQIYEEEIIRMKKNLEIANNKIENYKNGLEKDYNNLLIDKKKKDRKIIVLKNEIKRSNEIGNDKKKELLNEIEKRNKIIKLLQKQLEKQQQKKGEKDNKINENKIKENKIKENEIKENEKEEEEEEKKDINEDNKNKDDKLILPEIKKVEQNPIEIVNEEELKRKEEIKKYKLAEQIAKTEQMKAVHSVNSIKKLLQREGLDKMEEVAPLRITVIKDNPLANCDDYQANKLPFLHSLPLV
jgi:hypothetical protein